MFPDDSPARAAILPDRQTSLGSMQNDVLHLI
jgi:hypothetical protein